MSNSSPVCLAFSGRFKGGAEALMIELGDLFDSKGIDVQYLLNGTGEVFNEVTQSGSSPEKVSFEGYGSWKQPIKFFRRVYQVSSLFRRSNVKICVVEGKVLTQVLSLAGRLSGTKVVSYVHFPPGKWEARRVLYHLCHRVVLCCENLRKYFPSLEDGDFLTIRNYIDSGKFSVVRPRPGDGLLRIVLVGHLSKVKGQEVMIEVFSDLLESYQNLELVFAGADNSEDKNNLARMRKMISKLGLEEKVILAGKVNDIVALYARSDIFVLPSLKEGLPLVILEAMSCGLPVVATDVDGTPEAVDDGKTGLLVPVDEGKCDKDALKQALVRLIEDLELRERMGKSGSQRVKEEFSKSGYQEQFIDLIRGMESND